MVEPTIPTVQSGDLGQHSHWAVMQIKVQDLTDGHRHDGVGSFGPLTAFSAARFTNISANALFVASTVGFYGPVTVSGNLAAINYSSAGTLAAGGNVSFGGTLVVQSAFTPGVYAAPGNLSSSGIVSQLVAGSNITVSGASGVGVVAVGVGGTTVFAGTNQSLGTLVLGSGLELNTFQVSGLTTLAGLVTDNISSAGSVYAQSRLQSFDAIHANNLSTGSAYVTSSLTVGGPTQFSQGLVIGNISTDTLVTGSAQIGHLANTSRYRLTNTNASAGDFRIFNMSAGRTYLTLNAQNASAVPDVSGSPGLMEFYDNITAVSATWGVQMTPTSGIVNTLITLDSSGAKIFGNLSGTGSLQMQSRIAANDGVITGNFSAGSLYAGSSILLNYSSNVGIIASAQIATLTNLSLYNMPNVNTSVGSFRLFTTSAGQGFITLNAGPTGTADTATGVGQIREILEQLSATPPRIQWQIGSSGTFTTQMQLTSSGLIVPNNLSVGSLVMGSAQATNISTGRLVAGSSQITQLTLTSALLFNTSLTNGSAGSFFIFQLSSGRTYITENTANASAIPQVSTTAMLLQYYDYSSPQFTFQYAPTSGVIRSLMQITPTGVTVGNTSDLGTGAFLGARTVTVSTNSSANDYLIVVQQSSVNLAVSLARARSSLGQHLTIYATSGTGTVITFTTSTDQINFLGGSADSIAVETAHRYYALNQSSWLIV